MEEKNQLEKLEIKRPWQANIWIGLIMFGLIFWIVLVGLFLCASDQINLIKDGFWVIILMSLYFLYLFSFIPFTSIIFAPILYYVVDRGYYYENLILIFLGFILFLSNIFLAKFFLKTNKKVIIISIYSHITGIVILLFGFLFIDRNPFMIVAILLSIIPLYLLRACLKHPFYNQKKVEQKS